MLTKEESFILDLIDQIEDPERKRKALENYLVERPKEQPSRLSKQTDSSFRTVSLDQLIDRMHSIKEKEPTVQELKGEINQIKSEISQIKRKIEKIKANQPSTSKTPDTSDDEDKSSKIDHINGVNYIEPVVFQKWFIKVTIIVNNEYYLETEAMVDSGADINCITEGIIPSKYYSKTTQRVSAANKQPLNIRYKLDSAMVCNDGYCIPIPFIMVKGLSTAVILGNQFLQKIFPITSITEKGITSFVGGKEIKFPFTTVPKQYEVQLLNSLKERKTSFLNSLKEEVDFKQILERLAKPDLQEKIKSFEESIKRQICAEVPNAFWTRNKFVVTLPYEEGFNEKHISTKARPIAMGPKHLELCKKEINDLLNKGLIRQSYSQWSCPAFYVENAAELERGAPRLVINYKPLNAALKWIRYPIPNKRDLLNRLYKAKIFSKFDMKSGYWQIQIEEKDRYKTAFTVPFGHYEWNVMPFGLKNAPSEYQHIMNELFNPYTDFTIVYIDDVLVYSQTIDQHFKHLKVFLEVAKHAGLVVSAKKMSLFQLKIRFLGHYIENGLIQPIERAIIFADKFPDEILDKNQLQRFLGSLNYIADFYQELAIECKPLFDRLRKNPKPWSGAHTEAVRNLKKKLKELPCMAIAHPDYYKIVETDASERGYGGILKQKDPQTNQEQLVRYTSGLWNSAQQNYSTIKKEVLSIVLCVTKFESDLLNKKFLIRTDAKSAKSILEKDVRNLASKQIFAQMASYLIMFQF